MDLDRCLTVCYGHWPPYSVKLGNGNVGGVMKAFLQTLTSKLGICFILVEGKSWGTRLPNGSWTGMVGMCERGEVDFALGPMGISEERAEVMDVSAPLFMDQQTIAYKRPKLQPDLAGFIKPFTLQMWIMIAVAVTLVFAATSVLLSLLGNLQLWDQGGQHKSRSAISISQQIHHIGLWAYGLMLTQPMSWFPGSNTGRVVGGVWLLSSLIIATLYKSNLKAMLIIPHVTLPFNNLEEMTEQREIPYVLMGGSVVYNTLKHAPEDSLFGRAWQRRAGSAWTYQDGLRMILEEDNAIIVDRTTVNSILHTTFARTMSCPLWMTRETIVSYVLGLGFPKNSSLKPKMDKVIRSLREHGLLNYWMRRELQNATYCLIPPGSEPSGQRSLQFQDFYGIFFLLVAGECVSLAVFVAEVAWNKMNHRVVQSATYCRSPLIMDSTSMPPCL